MAIKCSKCIDNEFPCPDCRRKQLNDLKKELYKVIPWYLVVAVEIVDWWTTLGWLPYRLGLVKLKIN